MKTLFTLIIACITVGLSAQVKVDEKSVNIAGSSKNGFYISIPYGNAKQIESALKEELKDWKGKYSTPGYIFVDDCKMKDMGDNTFDVYALIEENAQGGANVSLAIDLGGAFLNSGEHGGQFGVMKTRLYNFGVKAAKSVIDEEIKLEEEALKARQKELADFEADQAKKTQEIEDYKKKISENEKAIEESKKNQETKKTEISEQQKKVEAVLAKKEAIK